MNLVTDFKKAIEDARRIEADSLAEGGAGNIEEYRYRVGVRKGLMKALRLFEDVVSDLEKKDSLGY